MMPLSLEDGISAVEKEMQQGYLGELQEKKINLILSFSYD